MDAIDARYSTPEAELDHLFSEMEEGAKIQLRRVEPEWADGNLGTFEWDPTEPISVDWIDKRFGGRKIAVKILGPKNQYRGNRTIKLPSPPKKDGIELVPGINGYPITAIEAKQQIAQANNDNGKDNGGMLDVLQKFVEMQSNQSALIQNMLLSRVASLETMLTEKLSEKATPNAPTLAGPHDPTSQLKTTLETMKMIDELKATVSDQSNDDESPQMYEKLIERFVEKFASAEPKPAPRPQAPPLPNPSQRDQISDIELMNMVKQRLDGMDPDTRDQVLNTIIDEYEESSEDNDKTDGHNLEQNVQLLGDEDIDTLNTQAKPERGPRPGGVDANDDSLPG